MTQKLISPQTPPAVLIHPLPSDYLLASGSNQANVIGARTMGFIRLTAWMPDAHGYCAFETRDSGDIEEQWIEDHCSGCRFNFQTKTDELDPPSDEILDSDGNPAVLIRYESRCAFGRGDCLDSVSFPCPAGYDGPDEEDDTQFNGFMPPMAYAADLHPLCGNIYNTYAWMQRVCWPDSHNRILTRPYRTINAFDDNRVCWGEDNSTPLSLPAAVVTYIDANANADLLPPYEFDLYRRDVRKACPSAHPPGVAIGPGYDAALLVSAQHHRSAYLLLRASGMPAVNGIIAAGLKQHVFQHDSPYGIETKGFVTDPNSDGRAWFFSLDPTGYPDQSQALLLAQLPACTSTTPSSSALAVPAVS
jgi:hypothetical protein